MIHRVVWNELKTHFSSHRSDVSALCATSIVSKVFASSQTDSKLPLVSKKFSSDSSQIQITINTKERIPSTVWQKIHALLIPSDFTWKNKERLWEASVTPMSQEASGLVEKYVQEVENSLDQIKEDEKAELDKKWMADEDRYIAKCYPEEHKRVAQANASAPNSKMDGSTLIEQILIQAREFVPKGIDQDRFVSSLKEALEKIDQIEEFEQSSIRKAALTASALGLIPNSFLQQCYFIPFKDQLHFVIGYKGLIELSLRSGEVSYYDAKCVYEKDSFEVSKDPSSPAIWHRPYDDVKNRGKISFIYAIRVLKNGERDVVVLSTHDLKKLIKSKANENSPWGLWTEEMCTKTAIKILAKQTELSIETQESKPE
jgi:recombination protein RecT